MAGETLRLKSHYEGAVRQALATKAGCSNPMEVPRLTKVVVGMGLGEAVQNSKVIESASEDLKKIVGQKPIVTRAKKSIAGFKLREGMPIGVKVTLRRARMWEFVERLLTFALPRVRDFKGISRKGFDGRGNYTLGLKEQIVFPEIDYDKVDKVRGMNVSFVTSAMTDEHARLMLEELGFPFRK